MKVSKSHSKFQPYTLTLEVESEEEHEFLRAIMSRTVTIPGMLYPEDTTSQEMCGNIMYDIFRKITFRV